MDISSYHNQVAKIESDITAIHKRIADESKKEFDKQSQVDSINRSINNNTSASSLTSKQSQIRNYQSDILKIQKVKVDLQKKLAERSKELNTKKQQISKLEEQERKRIQQENKNQSTYRQGSDLEEFEENIYPPYIQPNRAVNSLSQKFSSNNTSKSGEIDEQSTKKIKSPVIENELHENKIFIAGVNSDLDSGIDYLDITKDVAAFSRVISAKSFEPPLAIALFGKWGSGKSFFMKKLKEQIKDLSENDSYKHIYCQGISHIHFNAWSYIDANLWASVITKIFEGLNEYISQNTDSDIEKKNIEKKLIGNLSITKEAVTFLENKQIALDQQIQILEQKKQGLGEDLKTKINAVRETTAWSVVDSVNKNFNVQEELSASLAKNQNYIQSKEEINKIIPIQYLDNPEVAYNKAKSISTFLKEFFRKENIGQNLFWLCLILLLIFFIPPILFGLSSKLENINFTISQVGLSLLITIGAAWKRLETVYKKLQPIVASLWTVKDKYESAVNKVVAEFEQQEKVLKLEIEKDKSEIVLVQQQLQEAVNTRKDLEFKISNALATEALYSFIEKRTKSEDYKKHLGIISIIRKDFEILNSLFIDHNNEARSIEENEKFKSNFKKPLERIILYIDDLDRCPEENVVQVLEAVNLLMAYPLFVVIVGVDPRWVKNALLKKHSSQFTTEQDNDNLELIEPSNYLEKIFQIPFHLKDPKDLNVKEMIKQLAQFKPVVREKIVKDDLVFEPAVNKINPTNSEIINLIEQLNISGKEINLMTSLSKLIGSNPRGIKRFVNIYKIVKTHEELSIKHENQDMELVTIMFLIALSVGPLKNSYKKILEHLNGYNIASVFPIPMPDDAVLSKLLDVPATEPEALEVKDLLNRYIKDESDDKFIKSIPISSIYNYAPLIGRFMFQKV